MSTKLNRTHQIHKVSQKQKLHLQLKTKLINIPKGITLLEEN